MAKKIIDIFDHDTFVAIRDTDTSYFHTQPPKFQEGRKIWEKKILSIIDKANELQDNFILECVTKANKGYFNVEGKVLNQVLEYHVHNQLTFNME